MNRIIVLKNTISENLHYPVFFLISFVFFAFFSNYVLFYQEKSTLFILSSDYLIEHLHQPGALIVYLGKFFSSFYYSPVSGSVIVSLIICLIAFFTSKIYTFLSGEKENVLSIIICSTMFYLQADYHFQLYLSIGILLQLIFFYIIIRYLKGWLPVLLSPVLYLLSGGFFWILFLLYTVFLVLQDLRNNLKKILSLLILNLLLIYLLKEFFLFRTLKSLIIYPLSDQSTGSQYYIFISLVLFFILIPVIARPGIRVLSSLSFTGKIVKLYPLLLTIILSVTISFVRFDYKTKKYFKSENLFFQNKFEELIEYNKKNPAFNILTSYLNNIALCEKGILNDQLFHFLQKPDGQSLFLKWEMNEEILKLGCYFYYATGMINEAHRWAFENMVMKGHTPEGLIMLIKTELISGNYNMASKYIRILKKTVFYSKQAAGYEKLLFDDKAIESHPELGIKRKTRIKEDFFIITDDPYINIDKVLLSDSLNRNAFQYKLAYLLIRKDYKAIAAELPHLGRYGFKNTPEHLNEAVCVYRIIAQEPLTFPDKIQVDQKTEQRFKQYLQTLSSFNNDLKKAEPVLRQKFGTTFWYWALYR